MFYKSYLHYWKPSKGIAVIVEHSVWLATNGTRLFKALKIACLHFAMSQTADTLAKKIVDTFTEQLYSMTDTLANESEYLSDIAPKLYQITEQQLLCVFHPSIFWLGLHCLTAQDYKSHTKSGNLLIKAGQRFPSLILHLMQRLWIVDGGI